MPNAKIALVVLVLVGLIAGPGCGAGSESGSGSGRIDQDENVGPGPGIAMVSHGGMAWSGYLPLWSVWAAGEPYGDGSNLLEHEQIRIDLPGVPEGTEVRAFGFNTIGQEITSAWGPLGPMGVVLQMP